MSGDPTPDSEHDGRPGTDLVPAGREEIGRAHV